MQRLTQFLADSWCLVLLFAVAAGAGGAALLARRRRRPSALPLLVLASSFGLAGLGGLLTPLLEQAAPTLDSWPWWAAGVALAVLGGMLIVVLSTGRWWAPLGYAAGGLLLLGLGGLWTRPVSTAGAEAVRTLLRLQIMQPWWLLLLGFVPAVVWLSYRSLAGLGPVRRWLAIGLRCALIVLLTLALAEVRLRHQNENVTVFFVVDRSLSIPEDPAPDPNAPGGRVDRRWERIKRFINQSVEDWAPGHKDDRAGVIVFGRRPRLELPPSNAPRLNFTEVASTIDPTYTDIASAIKLALASFPEGAGKRIVLVSDGNENLGDAQEQAQIARTNGVQIDVVPLASGYRNETEVLVQAVEAPAQTEQNAQLPIRVLIRSYNPRTVVGTLTLNQISEGQSVPVGPPRHVQVQPGLNSFSFRKTLTGRQQSYTYEAVFQPEGIVNEKMELVQQGLPGDKAQNNRATTHVLAMGQRRVLLIESREGEQARLLETLRSVGGASKFNVHSVTVDQLPQDKTELAVFLSKYDCVILADVPASDVPSGDVPADRIPATITEEQQEVIRSNTHDQGCGLIMIGGPNGYGAGGWQGTPVEKALPVDCDIKSLKIQGKGGLVLIMHASEMADGNRWQKEIAKLAIKKLSATDEVGVLYFDWGNTKWHIPLQMIGNRRSSLLGLVDSMVPGDMPEFDTGLQMAYDALMKPEKELATRHVIIISDGDPSMTNTPLLAKMKANKVTVTTVGVATHGSPQDQALSGIARATGGRFYNVKSAKALPAIYIKETRLVSQSFVYEKAFQPAVSPRTGGPTDGLEKVPPLFGFVRTTPKESLLVDIPIDGPPMGELRFPVLAYWHYGLGKAVAFTSDARTAGDRLGWDRDWARSPMYSKFWEQVVDWSLRAVESGHLIMTTEYRDGRVRVTVDARDDQDRPLTDLNLRGRVTPPTGGPDAPQNLDLKFEQRNSGLYVAEFKADEAGSYFITAQPVRKIKTGKKDAQGREVEIEEGIDSVRAGVTIPYSPEFAEMESNTPLIEKLRQITGGKSYKDDDQALAEATRTSQVYRREGLPLARTLQPVWYWLLLMAGTLFFFDVAVRRIALDPAEVAVAGGRLWDRLRRRAQRVETPQFLERLKTRKAQVSESIERARAARRFEGAETAPAAPPPGAGETPPPAPSRPATTPPLPPPVGPEAEKEAGDFAGRLMKAKKRVWEEREKDKDKDK